MSASETPKSESFIDANARAIGNVAVAQIIVLLIATFHWHKVASWLESNSQGSLARVVLALALGALSGSLANVAVTMVPLKCREWAVYWRWKGRLPSYRAFPLDDKERKKFGGIDWEKMRQKHPKIRVEIEVKNLDSPDGKRRIEIKELDEYEQHALFQNFYKKYLGDSGVQALSKRYILMRDLTAIHVLMIFPFTAMVGFWTQNPCRGVAYFAIMLASYGACALAAINAGHEFVGTVLQREAA